MANTTIPQLPLAITLDGSEEIEIVQPPGDGGTSKRTTVNAIAGRAGGVVQVPLGGTGTSILAAHQVLVGNDTASVLTIANATAGYVLTANGTGSAPSFQGAGGLSSQPGISVLGVGGSATGTPSAIVGTGDQILRVDSSGTTLAFGTVNLSTSAAVTGVLPVSFGGIGAASLTAFTVLLGNGTSTPSQAGPGSAGQLLVGQTVASNPQFKTVGGDLTLSESGTATIGAGAVTFSKFQTISPLSVVANASSAATNVNAVGGAANQFLGVNTAGTGLAFVAINVATNVTGVLAVAQGGVGTSTLLSNGVLLGNGTAAVSAVTNVTSGYILTSNGPNSAPTFQGAGGLSNQPGLSVLGVTGAATATPTAITGTTDQVLRVATNGTALAFGTVNLSTSVAVTGTLPVSFGGVGTSTLTANAVLLGNGTSAISAITNVTSGFVLTSNGTASAPTFQGAGGLASQPGLSVLGVTATSTATPAAIVGTTDQVLVIAHNGTAFVFGQVNLATSAAVTGVLPVISGGHGTSSLTAHGVLVGAGTSTVIITAPGGAGQVLTGQGAAADPQFATIGGDITLSAAGTATIANNVVTYAKFQTVAALSVVANSSSATTNAAAVGGTANQALVVNSAGTGLAFGQVNLGAAAAITGALTSTNIATAAFMMLATTGQAFSGGVVLTTLSLGTAAGSTTTLVAGNNPTQRIVINGTATFVAPSSDCEIDLLVTNAASASTISFSGYSVGSNTGDTYDTTSGHKFIFMSRTINGSSTYAWKAFQ